MCTTAVGQQDEGNTFPLQELKRLRCSCQRLGAPEKDAINAVNKLEENSGCWVYEKSHSKAKAKSGTPTLVPGVLALLIRCVE